MLLFCSVSEFDDDLDFSSCLYFPSLLFNLIARQEVGLAG